MTMNRAWLLVLVIGVGVSPGCDRGGSGGPRSRPATGPENVYLTISGEKVLSLPVSIIETHAIRVGETILGDRKSGNSVEDTWGMTPGLIRWLNPKFELPEGSQIKVVKGPFYVVLDRQGNRLSVKIGEHVCGERPVRGLFNWPAERNGERRVLEGNPMGLRERAPQELSSRGVLEFALGFHDGVRIFSEHMQHVEDPDLRRLFEAVTSTWRVIIVDDRCFAALVYVLRPGASYLVED